jgi:V8-like Glu-specific endopeptidase
VIDYDLTLSGLAVNEIVNGTDDRIQVTNTTTYPWSMVVEITLNGAQYGSGILISPWHVLTAGHVVSSGGVSNRLQ